MQRGRKQQEVEELEEEQNDADDFSQNEDDVRATQEQQEEENNTLDDDRTIDRARRTTEYRRNIRRQMMELMETTVEKEKELVQAPTNNEYRRLIEDGNLLAKEVVHAREGALDAEWLSKISEIGLEQVTKIQVGQEWSADDFLEKLVSKYPAPATADFPINWINIGRDVLKYFLRTPSATFLHGPLRAEPKERKPARERRAKINLNADAEKPEEIREQQQAHNETEEKTSKLMKELKSKSHNGKDNVDYFSLVLDKQSFTKTIENMFYYSFLVKEGKASMQIQDDKVVGSYRDSHSLTAEDGGQDDRKQTVIKLNLDMWAKLVETSGGDASRLLEEAKKKMPSNPNAKRARPTNHNEEDSSDAEEQSSSSRTARKSRRK